jgi:hypothetical protein
MTTLVQLARRAIRWQVRAQYWLAVAWGNGPAADRCKVWLDGDMLYPLEKVATGKHRLSACPGEKVAARRGEGRYELVSEWLYPCAVCSVAPSKRFMFVCSECGETTCLDCDCACYRTEEL